MSNFCKYCNMEILEDFNEFACCDNDKIDRLEKENAELRDQCRWRDVNEELPESFDLVLAVCEERHVRIVSAGIGFKFSFTHWMPVPEFRSKANE